jgi:hypothetical protein
MDNKTLIEWLNRTGIILNFLAGFLMAPDIIGRQRLNRWESSIEKQLLFVVTPFSKITARLLNYIKSDKTIPWLLGKNIERSLILFTFASIAVTPGIFYFAANETGLVFISDYKPFVIFFFKTLVITLIYFKVIDFFTKYVPDIINALVGLCLFFFTLALGFIVIGVYVGIVLLFIYVIPKLLSDLISFILKRMEGQDRFASAFVICGVVFFIIGNLLQLIASFYV